MPQRNNVGWFDVGMRDDERVAVGEYSRLKEIASELENPQSQCPMLCAFLGRKNKDYALQQLFPQNNIKRHDSEANIKLRSDIVSSNSDWPVLFADGDTGQGNHPPTSKRLQPAARPVWWDCKSGKSLLLVIWARLVFLFTDVMCIFVEDFSGLDEVVEFLECCVRLQSASVLPHDIRPRIILAFQATTEQVSWGRQKEICQRLQDTVQGSFDSTFSGVHAVWLAGGWLSETARYEPLRSMVAAQLDSMRIVRQRHNILLSANNLMALFQTALDHTLQDIERPFELIRATRIGREVSPCLIPNLTHYFKIGAQPEKRLKDLAPSVASALFMDHYTPEMIGLDPRMVFWALYRPAVIEALTESKDSWTEFCPTAFTAMIEYHMDLLFTRFSRDIISSIDLRKEQLISQSGQLSSIKSNKICLYCLFHSAQHVLACGHTVCDRCVQVFGTPMKGFEYRFVVKGCLYCLYQRPLIADILPPTMSPSILAIDGGGVRGVIPLEFLFLIQENLGDCPLQDLVDLAIGTSSGGLIVLGLFLMRWDVPHCAKTFDQLASRIFQQRRQSTFPWPARQSILGNMTRWIQWLLHDSCYDSQIFDTALKDAFGKDRRIFGVSPDDPVGSLYAGSKFGVVTTSISKDTSTFVIGNFNRSHRSCDDYVRPQDLEHEPKAWQAYFTPIELGIGTFQDGGLKHNFAGEIAKQISHQIWPYSKGSTRMLSLGTGAAEPESNRSTPHFRHIFRDGFMRRGFDAWMSSMDTECDWRKMKSRINEANRPDYHRLNVTLGGLPSNVDAVESMDDYRDLVLLQPGSARMAREAAITFLISRFYFVLSGEVADNSTALTWCRGTIRCKGPARRVIMALQRLHPKGLNYTSDYGMVGIFAGLDGLCSSCGCYSHPIAFLVRHVDQVINIYLRADNKRQWKINGFPETLSSLIVKQGLNSSFGQADHGYPSRAPCITCDIAEDRVRPKTQDRRRKRDSQGSQDKRRKRIFNSNTFYTMAPSRFDPHRKDRARYNKRTHTLISKAHELATLCNADVYLIMSHPRGTTVYNSAADPNWPPPDRALELQFPDLKRESQASMTGPVTDPVVEDLKRLCGYFALREKFLNEVSTEESVKSPRVSKIIA
ncbi:unnamed protein product [Penicillium egyptiacum]|uniref:PNPLA domain-containing protein n=1 Tax=Penicillium egyptiacum TaxID=1303716 RepID=A0A9W4K8W2_9EURO|nr:unnamed protein product [Penicillium egyptiacum]